MDFKISVGKSDFTDLRMSGNYYVDKTEILYELVHDMGNEVTLFTRPRRFGKTLMMSMMESFFDIRKDSGKIFEGLKIKEHKEFCDKWMNQYPVLFVSFKDIEAENFHDAYDMLKTRLADVCKKLSGLAGDDRVNQFDSETFVRLEGQTGNTADVKNALKTIMRMMYAVYGRKVILLIDEYDVPLARSSEKDSAGNLFYAPMLDVIKGIMGISLKDNEYLEFAFVQRKDFYVADKFEALMNGKTIMRTISDELTYDTLHANEDNLWSVLLMTGYITKADPEEEGETVSLKIPNREIASIFEDTVAVYFKNSIDISTHISLMKALWNGDEDGAAKHLSELLWRTISYNDYHEDYYHAFLSGIFVGRGYEVDSNKEKGLGRPDILLKDKCNRRAIIIEAKKSKKESDMDNDCKEAVGQIIREKYAVGLYGYEQILCYGVAFFQKQAKVRKLAY